MITRCISRVKTIANVHTDARTARRKKSNSEERHVEYDGKDDEQNGKSLRAIEEDRGKRQKSIDEEETT